MKFRVEKPGPLESFRPCLSNELSESEARVRPTILLRTADFKSCFLQSSRSCSKNHRRQLVQGYFGVSLEHSKVCLKLLHQAPVACDDDNDDNNYRRRRRRLTSGAGHRKINTREESTGRKERTIFRLFCDKLAFLGAGFHLRLSAFPIALFFFSLLAPFPHHGGRNLLRFNLPCLLYLSLCPLCQHLVCSWLPRSLLAVFAVAHDLQKH